MQNMKKADLAQFSDDSVTASSSKETDSPRNNGKDGNYANLQLSSGFLGENEGKLMDSVIVNNEKVRYYYNKTLYLREPIGDILDMLEILHRTTFAYLSQLPETGDYSVISTLFELIPTLFGLIDWSHLNHSCYWEDFRRETKQLLHLLDKVNGAALKCSDTATKLLQQAREIFQGVVESDRRRLKLDRALSFRKESDYIHENTSTQNIQIHWNKPGDLIELLWHDADSGLLNVALKQTGVGFRIRFLRHILFYARGLLEKAYLSFMRINVALHLNIPIEKLAKCRDVHLRQLTHQENAFLIKAKREFDSSLDVVWQTVSRFKFQTFQLLKYSAQFKGMRSVHCTFTPKTVPSFTLLKMSIEDSLLLRVMSTGIQAQANQESFDFTVFPDRTEDIVSKVEELLAVDNSRYKSLFVLLSIIRIILPVERPNFTEKEKLSTADEIAMILDHRFQVRRSLKRALKLFEKHPAFYKVEQLKLLTPVKYFSRIRDDFDAYLSESSGISATQLEEIALSGSRSQRDGNNNEQQEIWISVEGGIKVTTDGSRGILTKSPFTNNDIKSYNELKKDERVILCVRLIRQLLVCIANEQCFAKIAAEQILETKSLVKRLKSKDRQNPDLQKAILENNKHLRVMLQLTKMLRFLKS